MRFNQVSANYFRWMVSIVDDGCADDYDSLMRMLFEKEFYTNIPMDYNRISDAMHLRTRFGYEAGYSEDDVADYIDIYPCTVLELMVALSLRIEEHIMCNEEFGDRTARWFWEMIENLGLDGQKDYCFDNFEASMIIDNFVNHAYGPHGEGGLFYVSNPKTDLSKEELWYQANWHFAELLRGE